VSDSNAPAPEKAAEGVASDVYAAELQDASVAYNATFGTRKIALLGSAPSSINRAPYTDPSWEIWGCSPASIGSVKRLDQWFELHAMNDGSMTPDYIAWMASVGKPVQMIDAVPQVPLSARFPREAMLAEFGPYFFTSSLSWMFAMAILQKPAEIGLWGVDMSHTSEYGQQRPGCHYFITLAIQRGIKVFIPDESDLARPPAQYGFTAVNPMRVKLELRRIELMNNQAAAMSAYEQERNKYNFYTGALEDLNYVLNTWVD